MELDGVEASGEPDLETYVQMVLRRMASKPEEFYEYNTWGALFGQLSNWTHYKQMARAGHFTPRPLPYLSDDQIERLYYGWMKCREQGFKDMVKSQLVRGAAPSSQQGVNPSPFNVPASNNTMSREFIL